MNTENESPKGAKMSKPDNFEAARALVALLEPFDAVGREKIIRWAREELGLPTDADEHHRQNKRSPPTDQTPGAKDFVSTTPKPIGHVTDLKAFVESKAPKTDQHFAAVVAYYLAFEAPEGKRKEEIGPDDYLEACRVAPWRRPGGDPVFPLRNAFSSGLFDKGSAPKLFKLSTVGENLVAMALPTSKTTPTKTKGRASGGRSGGARTKINRRTKKS